MQGDGLTIFTDRDVSESQRNQILGHAHSETFLKFYMSQHIIVDVQAAFLGHESMSKPHQRDWEPLSTLRP